MFHTLFRVRPVGGFCARIGSAHLLLPAGLSEGAARRHAVHSRPIRAILAHADTPFDLRLRLPDLARHHRGHGCDPLLGGALAHLQVRVREAVVVGGEGGARGIAAHLRHLLDQPCAARPDFLFPVVADLARASVDLGAPSHSRPDRVRLGAVREQQLPHQPLPAGGLRLLWRQHHQLGRRHRVDDNGLPDCLAAAGLGQRRAADRHRSDRGHPDPRQPPAQHHQPDPSDRLDHQVAGAEDKPWPPRSSPSG